MSVIIASTVDLQGQFILHDVKEETGLTKELTGGKVNYYLVHIKHPQRVEQPPYQAECEDIGEELGLTPNEMNIFKAIWRSAAARKGNGKPDHKAKYDAEKMVHYAQRHLNWITRNESN